MHQAEKDKIVKSVMNLNSTEVDNGYILDVIISGQVRMHTNYLMVCLSRSVFRHERLQGLLACAEPAPG
ncbi:hypothetical protein PTKIN_Ptkin10aG0071100 [Pterospermum kingtungense]